MKSLANSLSKLNKEEVRERAEIQKLIVTISSHLKALEQVDDVGVRGNEQVNIELLGTLIVGNWAVGNRLLGDDLDSYDLASEEILGLEDQAKGAMVEGRDGLISSIEHNTFLELVAHTIHR